MITESDKSVHFYWTTDGKPGVMDAIVEALAKYGPLRAERDALRAERDALRAERDAAAEAAPTKPSLFAVCDCGAHEAGLVDEDGLCVVCGCDVVVVVDRHSADLVAQLRQGRGVDERLDAATRRAEEAEAALATVQGEGVAAWRPIATAPKGGARVLLWYAPTRIDKGEAVEGFWDALFDGHWMTSRGASFIDGRLRQPTHWMPLPSGPTEGA